MFTYYGIGINIALGYKTDIWRKIMEKQYTVKMTITVDDEVAGELTLSEIIFEALEDAPFQVDCIQVD